MSQKRSDKSRSSGAAHITGRPEGRLSNGRPSPKAHSKRNHTPAKPGRSTPSSSLFATIGSAASGRTFDKKKRS